MVVSVEELRSAMDIVKRLLAQEVADKAEDLLKQDLKRYYMEFTPEYYKRTYQLRDESLRRSYVSANNTVILELDGDGLKYKSGVSGDFVIRQAATGSHGGAVVTTPIYYTALSTLQTSLRAIVQAAGAEIGIKII